MAVTTPILNLLYLDSHSCYSMVLADISQYPENFTIVSPSIQITMPQGGYITLPFEAKNVNVFNSTSLKITCDDDELAPLPDGVYQFKYMINPFATYYVEKSILRIDRLQEKFDNAFLKLDLDCSTPSQERKELLGIETIIQEAVAAANKCAIDLSIKMYRLASKLLDKFNC